MQDLNPDPAPLSRRAGAGLLLDTLEGPIRHALLHWALDCGVFDLSAEPQDEAALAARLGLPPARLGIALRALVAAGFMMREGAGFRTSPDILPFVAEGSPQNMVATLRGMAQTRHAGLSQIADLIGGTAAPAGPRLFDDAHWDGNHRALAGFHAAIAADATLPCLTALPEWPKVRHLLDVGPGSAVLARRLLAQRPDLAITLFDLPPVAQRIAQEAADLPLSVIGGNYNNALPEGLFDLIWCSMTLYFHDQGLPALVARLADRLAPGGVLLSFHEALEADRTAPAEHVIGRLMPALRQGDVSFAAGQMAQAMAVAGLIRAESRILSTPFGRFRLDAARREA
ncbi:class I SAM-dependent methyltransferase [Gemmobacter serpentinus]|uniref:class I SAM-dependent methyltransferase n=1 Tax=Gemmobacter serpentinus TaxID=2652247 RepID=UPI00124E087C|nr:class I SAM-dependent methyltransferase [Gemmobacter serpentinus]